MTLLTSRCRVVSQVAVHDGLSRRDGDGMPAIRTAPVPLPADVVEYVSETFRLANDAAAGRLDRMPKTHEENLDFAFIDSLASATGSHVVSSGVVVDFDIHFVGGGHHWERWEVADLGLIVNFRRTGRLIRTKVLLLQSKRLYPIEADFVEFRGLARMGGFGSLMEDPWLLQRRHGPSHSSPSVATKPCRLATTNGPESKPMKSSTPSPFTTCCTTRASCPTPARSPRGYLSRLEPDPRLWAPESCLRTRYVRRRSLAQAMTPLRMLNSIGAPSHQACSFRTSSATKY